MVTNFWHELRTRNAKTGDLLLFSKEGCEDQEPYFLGTMLKKPLVQTLVAAEVGDEHVWYAMSAEGIPATSISHELFLQFVRNQFGQSGSSAGSENVDVRVHVELWRCQAYVDNETRLKIQASERMGEFTITTTKQHTDKVYVKLPASLRRPRPRKKRKASSKQQEKDKRRAPLGVGLSVAGVADVDASGSDVDRLDRDKSERGDSSASSNELLEETEVVVPASAVVAAEEKSFASVAKEIDPLAAQPPESQEVSSEAIRLQEMPAQPFGTYFSRKLGLHEAGSAASGRAQCLCCKKLIPKGAVRFSYYYSTAKPYAWLHAHCTKQYVLENQRQGSLQNSITCLRGVIASCRANTGLSSASKSQPIVKEILSWSEKILVALQQQPQQQQQEEAPL